MQARRILLVFAMALLVTAAAASFVPVPEEAEREPPGSAADEPGEPAVPRGDGGGDAIEVEFEASAEPRTETVARGSHVIVTAAAPRTGQVELEGLDQIEPVAPGTPALFDLFTDRSGRFDVVYVPTEGPKRRLGTLVVDGGAGGEAGRVWRFVAYAPTDGSPPLRAAARITSTGAA